MGSRDDDTCYDGRRSGKGDTGEDESILLVLHFGWMFRLLKSACPKSSFSVADMGVMGNGGLRQMAKLARAEREGRGS